jgi:hypothetical protein
MTLGVRDLLPMFTVTNTVDGALVCYQDIWQRKNLLLVMAPEDDPTSAAYAKALIEGLPIVGAEDTTVIVTSNTVAGIPSPGVLVADRWGEIYYLTGAGRTADLPAAPELTEWLRYVQNECPECQGEAR